MPLIETRGAGSAQGFGEFAQSTAPVYIEDVFSTYLYTGNQTARSIVNGIDLSTKGGMVWTKCRSAAGAHAIFDTARGTTGQLNSGSTAAAVAVTDALTAYNTDGYSLGVDNANGNVNNNGFTFASWTFRKQKKFFDVVTYTGNGSNRTISHNLGSVPGCIIVKRTDTTADWQVYHRANTANPETDYLVLNSTAATADDATRWNDTLPTSAVFSLGTDATVNASGGTYVAYLFAHDAGGFGLSGSDNVISCGSFVGNNSTPVSVTLGWETQWLLVRATNGNNWYMFDTMRGFVASPGTSSKALYPNLSDAEASWNLVVEPTATGFSFTTNNTSTWIYIAIRRGPMKVPTSGTSVFTPIAKTGDGSTTTVTNVGFPTDLFMFKWTASAYGWKQQDRLRGFEQQLSSDQTGGESNSGTYTFGTVNNTGYTYGANASTSGELNGSGVTSSVLAFRRAPGFFDIVCYTGNATNGRSITHNLGVVPEILIVKKRSGGAGWITLITSAMRVIEIDLDSGYKLATSTKFYYGDGSSDIAPTSSVFTVASGGDVNGSGSTYVAYLFATLAGVSKVGSYTGTGALQTINCGFTGGARFVLIKRTDSTGGWFVYDSARGISSGNDPYLLLDVVDAEVTGTNYVDTASTGFQVTAAAPAELNANGGSYIFLAIA